MLCYIIKNQSNKCFVTIKITFRNVSNLKIVRRNETYERNMIIFVFRNKQNVI